jgi:hypothetical protein
MGNQAINQSTRSIEGENQYFNEGAWQNQLRANVIKKTNNFQSLIYDEMIPGRTMYDDLLTRTMAGTYNDLGVTNIDGVNPNDGIDEREAKLIVDEMIANPDYKEQLEEEMMGYYTSYLKNQWSIGERNRPKPIKDKMKTHTYDENIMMAEVLEKTKNPIQYTPGAIAEQIRKRKNQEDSKENKGNRA